MSQQVQFLVIDKLSRVVNQSYWSMGDTSMQIITPVYAVLSLYMGYACLDNTYAHRNFLCHIRIVFEQRTVTTRKLVSLVHVLLFECCQYSTNSSKPQPMHSIRWRTWLCVMRYACSALCSVRTSKLNRNWSRLLVSLWVIFPDVLIAIRERFKQAMCLVYIYAYVCMSR